MTKDDDRIGKPVGFGFGSPYTPADSGPEGVALEPERRDMAREREQLLGAIWVLVDRLGGIATVRFDEFAAAAEAGAHLMVKTSAEHSELTFSAEKRPPPCNPK
jgi:hypothetical protein